MCAAIAKQVRGDAALRTVPLFRISVGFGLRGVCLSAARSAALVSRQ